MWLVTYDQLSPAVQAALDAYNQVKDELEAKRHALRAAIAADLKTHDLSSEDMAKLLPWSGEMVRGIAREYDVPPKRKPTVRSIKPQKRTPRST